MRHHLRTLLVLVLLAATAVAFVVTEDLKLEPDPIARPRIDRTFSPVCDCERETARIAFRLRRPDTLTLTIADDQGQLVRTLLNKAGFRPGTHQFGAAVRRQRIAFEHQADPRPFGGGDGQVRKMRVSRQRR